MTFARPKYRAQRRSGTPTVPRSEASRQAADDEAPLSTTGSRPNLQNAVYAGVAAHQTAPKPVAPLARIFSPEKQPRHARRRVADNVMHPS
jgi:hypothetical protein